MTLIQLREGTPAEATFKYVEKTAVTAFVELARHQTNQSTSWATNARVRTELSALGAIVQLFLDLPTAE